MNFLDKAGAFLKAHWPAIAAFGLAFWAQFGSQITAFVELHPKLSFWYAAASFTVAYYLKSPFTKSS